MKQEHRVGFCCCFFFHTFFFKVAALSKPLSLQTKFCCLLRASTSPVSQGVPASLGAWPVCVCAAWQEHRVGLIPECSSCCFCPRKSQVMGEPTLLLTLQSFYPKSVPSSGEQARWKQLNTNISQLAECISFFPPIWIIEEKNRQSISSEGYKSCVPPHKARGAKERCVMLSGQLRAKCNRLSAARVLRTISHVVSKKLKIYAEKWFAEENFECVRKRGALEQSCAHEHLGSTLLKEAFIFS